MDNMHSISKKILLAVASLALAATALGQENNPPKVSVKLDKPQAAAGSQIKATVSLTFAEGLHGYQNPPSDDNSLPVVVKIDGKEFKLLKVLYPKGVDMKMSGMDKASKVYEGTVQIPIVIQASTKPGDRPMKVVVSYQQCNQQACFPPGEVSTVAKVKITPKAKAH